MVVALVFGENRHGGGSGDVVCRDKACLVSTVVAIVLRVAIGIPLGHAAMIIC
jgi:hypothetical protein